jgi:predicted acetyltransferase
VRHHAHRKEALEAPQQRRALDRESTNMHIELVEATLADKPVLGNLLELYQHDFTEFDGRDIPADGRFGYRYLDDYWTEPGRHAFLIRAGGRIAGFVLLRRAPSAVADGEVMDVAEFFVMRKYRGHGVGAEAARRAFDRFPGRWEVREIAANLPAQAFWRNVIGAYTNGHFEERTHPQGPIQSFNNLPPVPTP